MPPGDVGSEGESKSTGTRKSTKSLEQRHPIYFWISTHVNMRYGWGFLNGRYRRARTIAYSVGGGDGTWRRYLEVSPLDFRSNTTIFRWGTRRSYAKRRDDLINGHLYIRAAVKTYPSLYALKYRRSGQYRTFINPELRDLGANVRLDSVQDVQHFFSIARSDRVDNLYVDLTEQDYNQLLAAARQELDHILQLHLRTNTNTPVDLIDANDVKTLRMARDKVTFLERLKTRIALPNVPASAIDVYTYGGMNSSEQVKNFVHSFDAINATSEDSQRLFLGYYGKMEELGDIDIVMDRYPVYLARLQLEANLVANYLALTEQERAQVSPDVFRRVQIAGHYVYHIEAMLSIIEARMRVFLDINKDKTSAVQKSLKDLGLSPNKTESLLALATQQNIYPSDKTRGAPKENVPYFFKNNWVTKQVSNYNDHLGKVAQLSVSLSKWTTDNYQLRQNNRHYAMRSDLGKKAVVTGTFIESKRTSKQHLSDKGRDDAWQVQREALQKSYKGNPKALSYVNQSASNAHGTGAIPTFVLFDCTGKGRDIRNFDTPSLNVTHIAPDNRISAVDNQLFKMSPFASVQHDHARVDRELAARRSQIRPVQPVQPQAGGAGMMGMN